MKTSTVLSKPLAWALPSAALVALLSTMPPVTMPGIEPSPFRTGVVGVVAGDVVQLNASNLSAVRTVSAQLQILSAAGTELATSTLVLRPGQSVRLLLKPSGARRRSVRGVVTALGTRVGATPTDQELIASTMEVFDARTRATRIVLTR